MLKRLCATSKWQLLISCQQMTYKVQIFMDGWYLRKTTDVKLLIPLPSRIESLRKIILKSCRKEKLEIKCLVSPKHKLLHLNKTLDCIILTFHFSAVIRIDLNQYRLVLIRCITIEVSINSAFESEKVLCYF